VGLYGGRILFLPLGAQLLSSFPKQPFFPPRKHQIRSSPVCCACHFLVPVVMLPSLLRKPF